MGQDAGAHLAADTRLRVHVHKGKCTSLGGACIVTVWWLVVQAQYDLIAYCARQGKYIACLPRKLMTLLVVSERSADRNYAASAAVQHCYHHEQPCVARPAGLKEYL